MLVWAALRRKEMLAAAIVFCVVGSAGARLIALGTAERAREAHATAEVATAAAARAIERVLARLDEQAKRESTRPAGAAAEAAPAAPAAVAPRTASAEAPVVLH